MSSINLDKGYAQKTLELPDHLKVFLQKQDWQGLDQALTPLIQPQSCLYQALRLYISFETIEYITSVRDAKNEWEEDGIWHDDGSRVLAFSLSLNLNPQEMEGGEIGFRKKNHSQSSLIPIQPYGELMIFATGYWGWEHKVYKVRKGIRVVMAGWCSTKE